LGGAYLFDGNDRITVEENGSSLGGDGTWDEISVEFWVRRTGSTSTEDVIRLHDAGNDEIGYRARFRAYGSTQDRFYWYVYNDLGDSESLEFRDSVNEGEWHYFVGTYKSGEGLKLFVDGVERDSAMFSGNINPVGDGILDIGGLGGSSDFSGLLDEVRIYPKALHPLQIALRYNETKNGLSDNSTIYWQETNVGETWRCEVTPNDGFGFLFSRATTLWQ
jgi:hypothetical protein